MLNLALSDIQFYCHHEASRKSLLYAPCWLCWCQSLSLLYLFQLIFSLWLAVTVVTSAGQQTEEDAQPRHGDTLRFRRLYNYCHMPFARPQLVLGVRDDEACLIISVTL